MVEMKKPVAAILLATFMILSVGMGASIVGAGEVPAPPHRVYGDVAYADGTPVADVNIYFKDDAGNVVASDVTDGSGFYDTDALPGENNNIPEPADKSLDIYVDNWFSGKILQWESGKSERIDITVILVSLGKPALYLPENSSITTDNTPTFEWTLGANAENHRLLVDNDQDFPTPVENVLLGATDNTYTPTTELSVDNYWWKVIAINPVGENESDTWTFSIVTVPPTKPALVSPADEAVLTENRPTFEWEIGLYADNHRLLVDNDSEFSSPEENVLLEPTDTTYAVSEPGLPDGSYSWKVIAINPVGENESDVWTFEVKSVFVRGVEVSISPAYWSALPGATVSYEVTVSNTGDVDDTYDLTVSDNESWIPTISPTSLTIPAGAVDSATLSVTIPEDAVIHTRDNITVVATSRENAEVSSSASCIAHVVVLGEITLTPSSGFAATTVSGSRFTANSEITIKWGDSVIPTVPATVETEDDGSFTAIISVLNQDEPGDYTVTATDEVGITASATFTVLDMKGEGGDPGDQGLPGDKGDKGDTGDAGSAGPTGPKGDTGDAGSAGPTGPKGDKGDTGSAGPQGTAGEDVSSGVAWASLIISIVALIAVAYIFVTKHKRG